MSLELIGFVTLTVLALKSIYNIFFFVYSAYLAFILGLNLKLRNYGPWAGRVTYYF